MTKRPADNHRFGRHLRRWPEGEQRALDLRPKLPPFEVWRSRDWLVQVFNESGHIRVSVNRAVSLNGRGFLAGITWDELQQIKRDIGRGDQWAVEVFPPDADVVNVANMRHLWLLPEAPAYGWMQAGVAA